MCENFIRIKKDSLQSLTWELANEKSIEVTGKPLKISKEQFYNALKPDFFVKVRTLKGGPAPATMRNSLFQAQAVSPLLEHWVKEKDEQIVQCEEQLQKFLEGWNKE